ncbi:MAG TPA: hypothetical protein VFU97_20060 [Xanthobacteraceae bacterium]|nr:hypothetical protein [Xanthobacteraceae bacterium]
MTIASPQFASSRLASAAALAARGRAAYAIANGLDPAQARREAVASIGRAVSYEASIISSTDMLVLLGLALVLALALALGVRRDSDAEVGLSGFIFLASPSPRHFD